MNDSGALWESYKTSEQRAGPLPMASTPKTPRSIRGPETPNVTNIIVVEREQDENTDLANRTHGISCPNCAELKTEIHLLREKVERQSQYIKTLTKCFNSTSEIDSSESQHGNGSTASTTKSTKVQRVTPTKRETSTSSSSTSSGTASPAIRNISGATPIVRQILQQLPITPRSARSSGNNPESMPRGVRPLNRTSSTASSISTVQVVPATPSRRGQLPRIITTPHSQPMGTSRQRNRPSESLILPNLPQHAATERRTQSRRRLFANEPEPNYQRSQSENAIEHLAISPVKDEQWKRACPPRVHLERNRPEFIERLEARQSIIRAASEKRAEIEHRKRLAARAVACGQTTVDRVSRELFADSTAVKAFYEKDMKEITLRNIRKSTSYQSQVWQRMTKVDQAANRILSQTHSLRARSTSRSRRNY